MRILTIIPARKNSIRLPEKNLELFGGKTLINLALGCASYGGGNEIVIATDYKIEQLPQGARPDGFWHYIHLPEVLTQPNVSLEIVIEYIMDFTYFRDIDTIVILQPTSPLRTPKHVTEAINRFSVTGCDSLFSGYLSEKFQWSWTASGALPINYIPETRPRSQDALKYITENGAIYIFKKEMFRQKKCRLGGKIGIYLMDKSASIEIDTEEDLKIARSLWNGFGYGNN